MLHVSKKGGVSMKWRGNNLSAGEKLNKVFGKILGKRGFYYLMMIAALGLALGAGVKWHPGG
jgi:hypothetical protein